MVGVRGDGLGKTRTGQNKTRAGQARVAGKVPAGRDVRSSSSVFNIPSTCGGNCGIWADERM